MRIERSPGVGRATLVCALALLAGCTLAERAYEEATVRRPGEGVDVNRAPRDVIADLPGVTDLDADRIVAKRPYEDKADLVRRGVVSQGEFDEIRDRIYVGRLDAARTLEPPPADADDTDTGD
jgi:DNA uptake protein ComE-like DNA-binding protein